MEDLILFGTMSFIVNLLNQPQVKEGIKNAAGAATCSFGLVEIYDGRILPKNWQTTADKVISVCSKSSLILSACVSRPGVYLISSLSGSLLCTEQLNRVFGPNTIFAINPWHPRHAASIGAVVLALPALVRAAFNPKKISNTELCLFFNTLTSRPVLHLGNQLAQLLIKS